MKNPIIRIIYLYLFALVGLGMLVVGSAMIINLGLKTWVFTKADQVDDYRSGPVPLYVDTNVDFKNMKELQACSDKCELNATQKQQINEWFGDYENWQNNEKNRNLSAYVVRNRQRQASTALSLILVGLPLWLFHWTTIKRDVRGRKEKEREEKV